MNSLTVGTRVECVTSNVFGEKYNGKCGVIDEVDEGSAQSYRVRFDFNDMSMWCYSVKPLAAAAPTLDQLLQDWRNADDFAQRKQTEADEAAAMRDERWQAVQTRAGEMGVPVVPVVSEPELVKPALTGKFHNTKLGSPEGYIPGRHWENEICDECGKRFGQHYNVRCNL